MTVLAAPPPIPGHPLDPSPRKTPDLIRHLDEAEGATGVGAGVAYRAITRLSFARVTLLAAGTTYYVFLALFSLVALGYGVTALFGADRIADYLTQALTEAFPGLLGDDGVDPERLRSVGQTASIIGLLAMLYSGSGAMVASSGSIHQIYGAPPDPRNYVHKRARLLGWLIVIGPLIVASLVAGVAVLNFSSRMMNNLGLEGTDGRIILHLGGTIVTLGLDVLVVYLFLGRLGGIRPFHRPLLIGSIIGGVAIQLLRIPMGLILSLSADKPQYGALALPIGMLLVLYLNSLALFGSAALTAAIAERNVPLDVARPDTDLETAQPDDAE